VDSAGAQGDKSSSAVSISEDGRFVAFMSNATNLVSADTNNAADVFVRDFEAGTMERVSVRSSGIEGNGSSWENAISANGQFVAFRSSAKNLVTGDTNGFDDVFVHDRQSGTTERVSVDSNGVQGNGNSYQPAISADGRFVVFWSLAGNLGSGGGGPDVFIHDRQTGITELVSVDSAGNPGWGDSYMDATCMSPDGRFVAFFSASSNLVANDVNGLWDVFLRDRQAGTTEIVSVDSSWTQGNGDSQSASISADGRFVAFWSSATNFVSGDVNAARDVFVRDRQTATTEIVSVDSAGLHANGDCFNPAISSDGHFVAFVSQATNLVGGDTNNRVDVFVHDRQTGVTIRSSVDSNGAQSDGDSRDPPMMSGDGRFTAFASDATNLVPGDTNGVSDIFVRGSHLTLEADPAAPLPGASITFNTWTGQVSGTALMVVIDINGTPMFLPAVLGSFDSGGRFSVSGTVPTGLSGNVITFETIGYVTASKIDLSNPFAVAFQ
jgi:Tol biopolymer transport system component